MSLTLQSFVNLNLVLYMSDSGRHFNFAFYYSYFS